MANWIVTANRLSDGAVVYLRGDRGWTGDLQQARSLGDAQAADDLLAWARGQEAVICDPYLSEVGVEGARLIPLTVRERIRAEGPRTKLQRLGYLPEREAAPARAAVG